MYRFFASCDTVCPKKNRHLNEEKCLVTYTTYWTSVQIIYFEKQLCWADCMIVGVRGFKTRARTVLSPLGREHILWCAERLLLNPYYLLLCRLGVSNSLVFRLLTVTRALLSTLTTISCQMLWSAGCWWWPEPYTYTYFCHCIRMLWFTGGLLWQRDDLHRGRSPLQLHVQRPCEGFQQHRRGRVQWIDRAANSRR